MKTIKITDNTDERIVSASGMAVVGAIPDKSGFVERLNLMDHTYNRAQRQIKIVTSFSPILPCSVWSIHSMKESMSSMMIRTSIKLRSSSRYRDYSLYP